VFSSNKLEITKDVSSLGLTHLLLRNLSIKILIGYKTVIVIEVSIILKSTFMWEDYIGSINAFEPYRFLYDTPKQVD